MESDTGHRSALDTDTNGETSHSLLSLHKRSCPTRRHTSGSALDDINLYLSIREVRCMGTPDRFVRSVNLCPVSENRLQCHESARVLLG